MPWALARILPTTPPAPKATQPPGLRLSCNSCALQVLELVFELLLTKSGELDLSCDLQPLDRRMLNIPHLLHHHLNHADNAALLAPLLERMHSIGPPAVRLMRLLCR